jgi:uncharacterized Ntn-hydrolase superfamily protein
VTTQALANPRHGEHGLLVVGAAPAYILAILLRTDADREQRQVALMSLYGEPAAFTGGDVCSWEGIAGSRIGGHCVVSGNGQAITT